MRFASLLTALAAAAAASAQTSVTIAVGAEATSTGGIFQFMPNQITAANGTVVTFQFTGIPGNHSVTQSTFASPCQPMAGGFDSGWVLVQAASNPPPQWSFTITNDQTPIWFFCKQLLPAPHCPVGMVGVINVKPGANSFSAFQSAAQKESTSGQSQNGLVGVGASASAEPFIPSGVTLFPSTLVPVTVPPPSAANTNSGASGSSTAPGGASQTAGSGAAIALGFDLHFMMVLGGIVAGALMVL